MKTEYTKPTLEEKIDFLRKNKEVLIKANGKEVDEEEGYVDETTFMIRMYSAIQEDLMKLKFPKTENINQQLRIINLLIKHFQNTVEKQYNRQDQSNLEVAKDIRDNILHLKKIETDEEI